MSCSVMYGVRIYSIEKKKQQGIESIKCLSAKIWIEDPKLHSFWSFMFSRLKREASDSFYV